MSGTNSSLTVILTMNSSNNSNFCDPFPYPSPFEIYAVLCPAIALLTLFTNILVIVVFTKKHLLSPTSVLLIGLAVSDILAGNIISPPFIYAYGIADTSQPLPYPMCLFYDYGSILAALFHQTSVWITMALGIQRYVVVSFPILGRRICTIKMSIVWVIIIAIAALVMYSITFFSTTYDSVEIDGKSLCVCMENPHFSDIVQIYNVSRGVFGQLIPCAVLTITTILLVRRLHITKNQMAKIRASENREREKKDNRSMRRTSYMVIAIVSCFLLAEIPNGCYFVAKAMNLSIFSPDADLKLSTVLNVLVYVVNHINFWIYVFLSRHFRRSLKKILRLNWLFHDCRRENSKLDSRPTTLFSSHSLG
ncbi:sex peptide receptor-like [Saccostrea echinata]|uniref:sex peptide receptor-like n=1 Tax=Saccostrea echinata TaxID=191078 RepID=UPI002A830320|nr:sex peptide receptor-like [Saccostrea echinata]